MNLLSSVPVFVLLLAGVAYADPPSGAAYIEGDNTEVGVLLAHGRDKHPRWLVVEPLRKGLNKQLGHPTLSLQMPRGRGHWMDYARTFQEAFATIRDGARFLKTERGVRSVILIGHSMGSRMAAAFVADNPDHGLDGLVVIGCRNNGEPPLACDRSLQRVGIPVLDVWGTADSRDSGDGAARRGLVSTSYQQVAIAGANHRFEGHEADLVDAVVFWLKKQR